jgi:HAMP domain-containing protein
MQEGAALFALRTRNVVIGILGGTLILIGFIVAFYAYRLTARIKYLTDITDRISVGDLDAEITGIKSRDEIGELANAIGRMQESIRLAIKRLRERK